MNRKILLSTSFLLLALTSVVSAAGVSSPLINCNTLFQGAGNPYIPQLAAITGYSSIVEITLLIILMMFCIIGATYAVGYAFHIETLLTFSKQEMLETGANLIIIAAVGASMTGAFAGIQFFASFAGLQPGSTAVVPGSTHGMYLLLCSNIQNTIMLKGLENWFGIFLNLYITNIFATGVPPNGGLTVYLMPNGFGAAFVPFQGMSLTTQLIWDEQIAYFSSIFLGMFMIVLLFMIYFLFPLFLYVGIALRSFPWTRPAGGSLIALFIAFYVVFPALIYPFTISNPATDPNAGQGFCQSAQFKDFSNLCNTSSFLTVSWGDFLNLITFTLGDLYYSDIYSFMEGMEFVGLSIVGLVIALLVSYELVEKLGGLLGAPSLQGSRVLGRIL